MDFYEVVKKRRSVREFQLKPVEEEKLLRVLEAGLKAPSHDHLRQWEFIFVRDAEQRKKIVGLGAKAENVTGQAELGKATEGMTDELQKEMYLRALPVQKRMLMSSPELLVVCFRMKKTLKECRTLYELNNFASVWACIENILLAMAAEGLYGVTYIPHETFSLKRILGMPQDYEIAAVIPLGYPTDYFVKQKTISLREKMHYNRW
ncbi:MAG TPA: nitroreductase family protein [Candidatus Krumholzibacteriaceae bacterium]|nr:nitroreductase family protein [Candidatus Krumholzibacteriaceae bacterium]